MIILNIMSFHKDKNFNLATKYQMETVCSHHLSDTWVNQQLSAVLLKAYRNADVVFVLKSGAVDRGPKCHREARMKLEV